MNHFLPTSLTNLHKFSISEIEQDLLTHNRRCIKIIINGDQIQLIKMNNHTYKKCRTNFVMYFLRKVVEKYTDINTTFFLNIDDWSSTINDVPIFVFSKRNYHKNTILFPDYLFLQNYAIYGGRNKNKKARRTHDDPGKSFNSIIKKWNNKTQYQHKWDKCFFRAGTSKNQVIIDMFKNHNKVDAQFSYNNWMHYGKMFKHKFVISHYMKWDSIYFYLKSDILVFLYTGFNTTLWYDLFLKDDIDYVSFKTKEEFDLKFNKLIDNPEKAKKIIQNSTLKADKFFRYGRAINYMGKVLTIYQENIQK